jgi:flagellin
LAISVSGAGALSPALQDLNTPGQGASGNPAPAASDGSATATAAVAIGQNGHLDLSTVDAIALGLNSAAGIADLALGAGQTVAGLLSVLQGQATVGQDPTLDPATRQALNTDFAATLGQIEATVQQASFDGVNLVSGATSGSLKIPGGGSLTPQDLSLGGPIVSVPPTAGLGSADAASGVLTEITASIGKLDAALGTLAEQAGQISAHGAIVGQLSDALKTGLPSTAEGADGARLLALQVQQQLGVQGQPIANQSPQLVLSLFR